MAGPSTDLSTSDHQLSFVAPYSDDAMSVIITIQVTATKADADDLVKVFDIEVGRNPYRVENINITDTNLLQCVNQYITASTRLTTEIKSLECPLTEPESGLIDPTIHITSLDGLEILNELTIIRLPGHNLTNVDLSVFNQIKKINFSNNENLSEFNPGQNNLTNI